MPAINQRHLLVNLQDKLVMKIHPMVTKRIDLWDKVVNYKPIKLWRTAKVIIKVLEWVMRPYFLIVIR